MVSIGVMSGVFSMVVLIMRLCLWMVLWCLCVLVFGVGLVGCVLVLVVVLVGDVVGSDVW